MKALIDNKVLFECMVLKPSMVLPGTKNVDRKNITPNIIAKYTLEAFSRTIVPAIPGIFVILT